MSRNDTTCHVSENDNYHPNPDDDDDIDEQSTTVEGDWDRAGSEDDDVCYDNASFAYAELRATRAMEARTERDSGGF